MRPPEVCVTLAASCLKISMVIRPNECCLLLHSRVTTELEVVNHFLSKKIAEGVCETF
jgi:hypothetical protein